MARNTNPWIKFFTRDWMESERIISMSCAAEGVYIRCLAAQGIRGNIPADLPKLARVLNKPLSEIENAWREVVVHFTSEQCEGEERLFNKKLREQIEEDEAKSKNYSKAHKKRHKVKSSSNLTQTCDEFDSKPSQKPSVSVSVSSSVSVSDSKAVLVKTLKDKFAAFYAVYPRKLKKPDAERAWTKHVKSVETADQIISHVSKRVIADPQWTKDGGQFIPYPATFLNAAGWLDEYQTSFTTPPRGMQSYKPRDEEHGVARYADLSNGWLTPDE